MAGSGRWESGFIPEAPGLVNSSYISFPAEEADGKDRAEYCNSKHDTDWQQDAARVDPEKCIFHHRKALCQREEADDLLHCRWHDLNGQRCAGENQHGEIENRCNDAELSFHPPAECELFLWRGALPHRWNKYRLRKY